MASSRTDLAWAAGLFEGEGCLWEFRTRQESPYLGLSLEMCDEEIVVRFLSVLVEHGVQNKAQIANRWRGNENHSRQYCIKMTGTPAEAAYLLLRPWLGTRRRKRGDEILAARAAARATMVTTGTCIGCGSEFTTVPMSRRKQWCSNDCYHRVASKTPHGRALANERGRRYKARLKALRVDAATSDRNATVRRGSSRQP